VPGPSSLPWEINEVPHGALHRHFYRSAVVGDDRDFYVYTPPDYSPIDSVAYPVLYLLHGFSDDASGWTAVGQAHVILDNLIAAGKIKPMLVVMPLGYGAPEIVSRTGLRDASAWRRNVEKFSESTLEELLPRVESLYRASKDRNQRAIAGLSMGGAQSLVTGLNALDRFAWIGAFSSGGLGEDFEGILPNLNSNANEQLRLLWIACGQEDHLLAGNRKFVDWLESKDVRFTWLETPGAHTWMVWRRYLAQFTPLLFR
jgi:enterochelin esterase-like enzyme